MNKYEKSLLFNLYMIKICFGIVVAINLLFPVYTDGELGFHSLFQWIVVGVYISGLLNALGYFNQRIPLLELGITRIAQVLFHVVISSTGINWIFYFIILIGDLLFIMLLLMDKNNYEYKKVDVN